LILSLHGSIPKNTATLQSKTPSAHTYRLLVFKEHSLKAACFLRLPHQEGGEL
jgi:hypothetical protein